MRLAWLVPIGLAAAALLADLPRAAVERAFSTGWYPRLQPVLTGLSGLLPFALLDLLLVGAGVLLVVRIARGARGPGGWRRWAVLARDLTLTAAVLYLTFLALWGLNYRRESLETRLDFDRARVTAEAVDEAAARAVSVLNRLDPVVHGAPEEAVSLAALRVSLAPAFGQAQRDLGASRLASPGRPKHTLLSPFFRWATVDGMLNPFGLEVLINPEVLAVERPFVLAHEWGHLAGWAREQEASYVGWLTCMHGDALARYSAWLSLYLHLRREVGPARRAALDAGLAEAPRADLHAIAERLRRGAPLVRSVSWVAYDRYLRANHADDGIRSYDGIVSLVVGTATDADGRPRLR